MKSYAKRFMTFAIALALTISLAGNSFNSIFIAKADSSRTLDVASVTVTPLVDFGYGAEFNTSANIGSINVEFTSTTGIPAGQGDLASVSTIGNFVILNGKTITQIIANNPGTSPIGGNRVQIHFDTNKMIIYIDKSINADDFIKIDGTDTFEITTDFKAVSGSIGNGNQLSTNAKFCFSSPYTSAVWERVPSELKVIGAGFTKMGTSYYAVQILFDYNPGILDNAQSTNDFIKNYVRFNGKTISSINQYETSLSPAITASYQSGNLLTFYFDQRINAANNFAFDGEDSIEIAAGFETINYGVVKTGVKIILSSANYGTAPDTSAFQIVNSFDVKKVTCSLDTGIPGVASITTEFTSSTGISAGQGDKSSVAAIGNNVKLNGKTISQIIANNPGQMAYIGGNRVQIHFDNQYMVVYFDMTINAADFIAVDGFDIFEISKDFVVTNATDSSKLYLSRDVKTRFASPATSPEWIRLSDNYPIDITTAAVFPMSGSYKAAIQLVFNKDPGAMDNIQQEYNVKNLIKINGKTVSQINAQTSMPVLEVHSSNGIITLYYKSTVSAENYFNFDGKDVIEVLQGFETINGGKLARNIRIKYTSANAGTLVSGLVAVDAASSLASPVIYGAKNKSTLTSRAGKGVITFNRGTATLNGNAFVSGDAVSATGTYTLTVTDSNNYTASSQFDYIKYGDVDGSGVVDSIDLIKEKNHVLNIQLLDGLYKKAGALYSEDEISIRDILAIKSYILGENIDQSLFVQYDSTATMLDTSSKVGYPFFTDKNDEFTQNLNSMWSKYGSVTDGTNAVYLYGNQPSYFEWQAIKVLWSDEYAYKWNVKDQIKNMAISSNGYLWSWSESSRWPSGSSYHFDGMAKYISAVYRVIAWENSLDFLDEVDTDTEPKAPQTDTQVDVSQGKTVRQKIDMIMNYMLETMQGKNGLMIIDNGENTGVYGSQKGSNYWDNFPMGYKDAYSNIYFYNALVTMSNIEKMAGNTASASVYSNYAAATKTAYNNTFYDSSKKRYIGSIDKNGVSHDLGFTFLNTEALTYGLGDSQKAADIFSWLDGTRIVAGDTSTGTDIYGAFKIAPRSTTVAASANWWNSLNGAIDVNTNAKFGEHLENGGAILYTSFYDMMARSYYLGANNAKARFDAIINEYKIDGLQRDPINSAGAPWVIGAIGEYPESGLVPTTFLYGFLGINAGAGALEISPNLPDGMKYGGVKDINYGGSKYDITVSKTKIVLDSSSGSAISVKLSRLKPNSNYILTVKDKTTSQVVSTQNIRTDSNGCATLNIDLTGSRIGTLEIL